MNDTRPLLGTLLLASIATLLAFLVRGGGLVLDVIPIAAVVAITALAYVRWRRVVVQPVVLFNALTSYFAGAFVAVLGANHLTAVVYMATRRAQQAQFVYDFRFYSLLLLGVLFIACGALATHFAADIVQHQLMRGVVVSWIALLVINLPLIPIQRFAILFSVMAVVELTLLLHLQRRLRSRRGAAS